MTPDELRSKAAAVLDGRLVSSLSKDEIDELITVASYLQDVLVAELENRGQLAFHEGRPCVPYNCELVQPCCLNGYAE